jgi:hypothetical protein
MASATTLNVFLRSAKSQTNLRKPPDDHLQSQREWLNHIKPPDFWSTEWLNNSSQATRYRNSDGMTIGTREFVLYTLAQAAITFAGFSGVVVAFLSLLSFASKEFSYRRYDYTRDSRRNNYTPINPWAVSTMEVILDCLKALQ